MIVGGGPAGLATARAYREAGGRAKITMVAAELYPPYQRPPLTKEYLRGEVGREELPIEHPRWYRENGVELRLDTSVTSLMRTEPSSRPRTARSTTTPACSPPGRSRCAYPCRARTTRRF